MEGVLKEIDSNSVSIGIDTTVYSELAIKEALNLYTDKFHCSIDRESSNQVNVHLRIKPEFFAAAINIKDIASNFLNDILDYQVRKDLAAKNQLLKELIVKQAFEPTSKCSAKSS